MNHPCHSQVDVRSPQLDVIDTLSDFGAKEDGGPAAQTAANDALLETWKMCLRGTKTANKSQAKR